jgi:hypothetical protein
MDETKTVPVTLSNDAKIRIEVTDLRGPEDSERSVADVIPDIHFSDVMHSIEGIAAEMGGILRRVGPTKAGIEFSIEVGLESGKLTALLVKGSGKANFKVSLGWDNIGEASESKKQKP